MSSFWDCHANLEIIFNLYILFIVSFLFCYILNYNFPKQPLWGSFSQFMSSTWWILCTPKDGLDKCSWQNVILSPSLLLKCHFWKGPALTTGTLFPLIRFVLFFFYTSKNGIILCITTCLLCHWNTTLWTQVLSFVPYSLIIWGQIIRR